jgi:GNAT superfamily N-acetyltransferase
MTPDGRSALDDAALLQAWRAGALPPRFTAVVRSHALWPTLASGATVTLERRPPWVGAIACVASGERLAWRRVIAVEDGAARLRAEVAPFDDGCWRELVGCADAPGVYGRLSALAPSVATALAWEAALRASRRRGRGVRESVRWVTRVLDAGDARARAAMLTRAYGGRPHGAAPATAVGLFAPDGTLVGEYHLLTDGDRGLSSGMVVEPAWRGRGGGVALARGVVSAARAMGLRGVGCAIAARNGPSVGAHERAGYVSTGRWRRWPDDPMLAAERQWLEFEARW